MDMSKDLMEFNKVMLGSLSQSKDDLEKLHQENLKDSERVKKRVEAGDGPYVDPDSEKYIPPEAIEQIEKVFKEHTEIKEVSTVLGVPETEVDPVMEKIRRENLAILKKRQEMKK